VSVQDHFSAQAAEYRLYRPTYPPALAEHLARLAPGRALALDVATGNGQAAVDLARHFERVLAGEPSERQLAAAAPHPRVTYVRHAAEVLPIRSHVADLVAVAQAAHWFDLDRFYAEARRVLKADGLIALWTYSLFRVEATTDAIVERFYRERVGPYWPPERRLVDAHYRTLPFPFEELPPPELELEVDWPLAALISYIGTWSAVGRFRSATGEDPLPEIASGLKSHWPPGGTRKIRFPIHLRIGRVQPI